MQHPFYSLLEEIAILGVIYGGLVWRVCNPAAAAVVEHAPDAPDAPHLIMRQMRHIYALFVVRDHTTVHPPPHQQK